MLENGKLAVDEIRDYFPDFSDEEIMEVKKRYPR